MKKQVLSIALSALMLGAAVPVLPVQEMTVCAEAYGALDYIILENGTYDFTYETDKYIEITFCDKTVTEVTIPDAIDGIPVARIGECAFAACDKLTSITIPETIQSMGEQAFSNCTALKSAVIKGQLGSQTFSGCSALETVTLSGYGASDENNFTSILGPFSECVNLTAINAEKHNTYSSVDGVLFSKDKKTLICYPYGKKQASYTIPNGVTSIRSGAFCVMPKNVRMNDEAKEDMVSAAKEFPLKSITIPDSMTSIDEGAFAVCMSLESVTIPDSVKSIGEMAFWGCISLKSVTLPDGVKSIGKNAFLSCASLESVTIPDSVKSIAEDVFTSEDTYRGVNLNCDKLTIHGNTGFLAEAYAKVNNIPFAPIGTAPKPALNGDVNGDGLVNLKDVVLIRRYIAGGWGVTL